MDDITAIVEQRYGDLTRYPHDPVEVVRDRSVPCPMASHTGKTARNATRSDTEYPLQLKSETVMNVNQPLAILQMTPIANGA